MSTAIQTLEDAQARGTALRPPVDGFPVLAEVLRQAGVRSYVCDVPAGSALFVTAAGPVVRQGAPLVDGLADIARFDLDALHATIAADRAGELTYTELLAGLWAAGCVRYDLDLAARTCTYHGIEGETYVERYRAVQLTQS